MQLPKTLAECEAIVIEAISSLSYGTRDSDAATWTASRKRMGFMDLGVDSLDAVKFVQSLNERFGLSLVGTVIFEQPNVTELAAFIYSKLEDAPSRRPASAPASHLIQYHRSLSVAGAKARWPGSAGPALTVLPAGGDGVSQVPSQRWDVAMDVVPSGRFGSFIPHADRFAAGFFGISAAETAATDPQQRLLLEHGYASLHAVRERREGLHAADVGIFLGIMNVDFGAMFVESSSVYAATGGTISIAAGRVSFALGMQGPCASYDTACSSALVAAHAGSSALRFNECESSLLLAVSLMLSPQVCKELISANLKPQLPMHISCI